VLVVILGPLVWCVAVALREGAELASRDWGDIQARLAKFRATFDLELPYPEQLSRLQTGLDDLLLLADVGQAAAPPPPADAVTQLVRDSVSLDRELEQLIESPEAELRERQRAMRARPGLERMIEELRGLDEQLKEPARVGETWDKIAFEDFQQRVDIIADSYRSARTQLLGGIPWAQLVELANPSPDQIEHWKQRSGAYLRSWLLSVSGHTPGILARFLLGMAVMIIAIYYFLVDGPQMIRAVMRLSPLDDQYEEALLKEFDSVSRAVVLATLLSALAQGLLAAIGYFFVGLRPLFLLTGLTALLALVPFVGASTIWVPACIYLAFVEEHTGRAIFLAVYGFFVISMADNIIKPLVLHGQSKLHPLLALLSVLGGVQALGPIGILVGPMVVSFLQALLNILRTELNRVERR
jgi:predicted PurR-regulated permease PerM